MNVVDSKWLDKWIRNLYWYHLSSFIHAHDGMNGTRRFLAGDPFGRSEPLQQTAAQDLRRMYCSPWAVRSPLGSTVYLVIILYNNWFLTVCPIRRKSWRTAHQGMLGLIRGSNGTYAHAEHPRKTSSRALQPVEAWLQLFCSVLVHWCKLRTQ
jgi:hypothetical protein